MKKILFPINFSPASTNAIKFAVTIANQMGWQLIFAHAYTTTSNPSVSGLILKRKAEQEIKKIIKEIKPELSKNIKISSIVRRAETVSFLKDLSKCVDLVVIGTEQKNNISHRLGGQITSQLIQQTKTPVLVIPQTYRLKTFKNIVLSLDNEPINDKKGIQVLKDLAHKFNSELTLFHTEEYAMDKGIHEKALAAFSDSVGYSIDYNFLQKNVSKSIAEMEVDYEVDLISLIKRKRSFWENFFHRSITNHEILNSRIPLLILHDT